MNTLSGSTRMVSPKRRLPAESQVHAVEVTLRWLGSCESSAKNEIHAPTNETSTAALATKPAGRRPSSFPASVIATAPASGATRQIQPPTTAVVTRSPAQARQPVDVEGEAPP